MKSIDNPDWQIKFKNLPEIPPQKRWNSDGTTTEQTLAQKILKEGLISQEEESQLQSLIDFYETLSIEIKKLKYKEFTDKDITNFKNYIFYAFNYTPLISNDYKIFQSFRLVVNESVTGKNESLEETKFLSYPPLEIVEKANKYNRANTPKTNVLYTTENINTALLELKPPLNKKLTIGIWSQKDQNKKLISYPISHSSEAISHNESVSLATFAFEEIAKRNIRILYDILRYYLQILGREYTKVVSNNHIEYLISSLFSERILNIRKDPNPNFNFDLIVYPSVGNKYKTLNFAIHPQTVDNDFLLTSLIEFEIEEEYYEYEQQYEDPFLVTVAKTKNIRHPKKIFNNDKIIW